MNRRSIIILAAAAMLAACAQVPKQAFNREAASQIKAVAVTRAPNQETYEAAIIGHPAASFGLIGAVIVAAETQSKSTRLTKAIGTDDMRLQERFAADLEKSLADSGYQVKIVSIGKEVAAEKTLEEARKQGSFDAVLETKVIGGYWAAGTNTNYVPRMLVSAKLVDAKSGATLFEDTFTYGYAAAQMKTIHVAADAKYAFADMDALTKDPDVTRQGLADGATAIAKQIATDLKKN